MNLNPLLVKRSAWMTRFLSNHYTRRMIIPSLLNLTLSHFRFPLPVREGFFAGVAMEASYMEKVLGLGKKRF
jgi:hypothetical protein